MLAEAATTSAPNFLEGWEIFWICCGVIGGLGLFLLGMKHMSEGLQTIAGDRLRRMIGFATNNRLVATGVGTGVTCVIQSSSVTTVMVVGFVNAGFMTLTQAIPVIMGANIGTTITGWILVLKIGKYGLPLLGAAALVYRFAKRDRWRYGAMAAMGVGMIFFGLELMSNSLKPLAQSEAFTAWFATFQAGSYFGVLKCAAIGCLLTMVVQSSSATLGITIGLAEAGLIPFETAAALILGENIGTTITAFLASLGATTNAKRAAYAHVIFNVIGVAWITAIFAAYMVLIRKVVGHDPNDIVNGNRVYIRGAIAMTHTGFNVTNTLLFLPLTGIMARVLTRMFPGKPYKETPHLTNLDVRLLETPMIGIEQCRKEIIHMGDQCGKMLMRLRNILSGKQATDSDIKKVFNKEEVLDVIQMEVVRFLTELLTGSVSHDSAGEGRSMLRMADELESVSDYVANLLKLHLRLKQDNLEFPPEESKAMLDLHDSVADYVRMVCTSYAQRHPEILAKARTGSDSITHKVRELRARHLAEMQKTQANPVMSMIYTDMLNAYRRVKDHTLNMAEALAGEK